MQTMSKAPKPKSIDERLSEIRERLSDARRLSGLTQTTVAEAMGLSNSQYSRLENGSTELTLRQFLVACEEVNLDPAELLGARAKMYVTDLRARLSASENKLAAITRALKVGDKDAWDK
jgi:transcriptional regulator with XRE-family HTH domain